MADLPSARSKRVDMRPTVDDEINAAWAEVNKARAEVARLREALNRICGLTHQDIDGPPTWALVSEIHRTARRAIEEPSR